MADIRIMEALRRHKCGIIIKKLENYHGICYH